VVAPSTDKTGGAIAVRPEIEVLSPADGRLVGTVADMNAEEVKAVAGRLRSLRVSGIGVGCARLTPNLRRRSR